MRRLLGTLVGGTLLLWTIAAAAGDVVKVGLIASYAGAFATWGSQFQQAVEAYQALYGNTVKGPDGEEIEVQFVYRDATSQGPDKAKLLAEELILHDHVKFLCGLELSPYAMALADISKEAKVPVVIMNAATASITRMSPYFVRVSQTVPQDVAPLGPWVVAHGINRVYTIVSDYAPGYDAETYFTKTFKAAGGRDRRQRAHAAAGDQFLGLYGARAAGKTRRALHVPAGRLALGRLCQGLCRAWLEGGRYQAARRR